MAITVFSLPENPPLVTDYSVIDLSLFDPTNNTITPSTMVKYDQVIGAFVNNFKIKPFPGEIPPSWRSTENNRAFCVIAGPVVSHLVRLKHVNGGRFSFVCTIPGESGFDPEMLSLNQTVRVPDLMPPNIPVGAISTKRQAAIQAANEGKLLKLQEDLARMEHLTPQQRLAELEVFAYDLFVAQLTSSEQEEVRKRIFKTTGLISFVNHLFASLNCWGLVKPTPTHRVSVRRPARLPAGERGDIVFPYIQFPIETRGEASQILNGTFWDPSAVLSLFRDPVVSKGTIKPQSSEVPIVETGEQEMTLPLANAIIYGKRETDNSSMVSDPAVVRDIGHNLEIVLRGLASTDEAPNTLIEQREGTQRHADHLDPAAAEKLKAQIRTVLSRKNAASKKSGS